MKDKILEVLDDKKDAVTLMEINDLMGLKTASELNELIQELKLLEEENIVYITKKEKYLLYKNCPFFKLGRLSVNKKGFGFVILDKEDDLYIDKANLNGAVHNDYVLAEIIKSGIKREGRVHKILNRQLDNLVGEVLIKDNKKIIDLDDDKLNLVLELDQESAKDTVEGPRFRADFRLFRYCSEYPNLSP